MPSDEEMDLNLQGKLIQDGKRLESLERNLPSPKTVLFCLAHILPFCQ